MAETRCLPCGDTALTLQLGEVIDRATAARVRALAEAVSAASLPGVLDSVPAYLSLTVHYDPLETSFAALADTLAPMAAGLSEAPAEAGRRWRLPVCFDGEGFAPDLPHVAAWAGLDPEAVIDDMIGAEQIVYMIGFAPGQPYLGDLPDRLAIPRRETPVQSIPAGSVVVATGKTVIYPVANPTGWHVVGRTPVPLFDMARDPPSLLAAGDSVRFERIDRAEFGALAAQAEQDDPAGLEGLLA